MNSPNPMPAKRDANHREDRPSRSMNITIAASMNTPPKRTWATCSPLAPPICGKPVSWRYSRVTVIVTTVATRKSSTCPAPSASRIGPHWRGFGGVGAVGFEVGSTGPAGAGSPASLRMRRMVAHR